jgi:putative ABC transport system substrate-binding protein
MVLTGGHVRRREFIGIFTTAAVWPGAVLGQKHKPVIASLGRASPDARGVQSFLRELQESGYVEGQNIVFERYSREDDPEDLRTVAAQLVQRRVDLILANGTQAALVAKRATDVIPIVASAMADPVADGLVASLARPGGNVTGNTFLGPELGLKRLQLLKETLPAAIRFAALQQPQVYSERTMQNMRGEMGEKAQGLGLALQIFSASKPEDFDAAFEAMTEWRAEALVTFPSPMFYRHYRRLVEVAAKHRLPTMFVFRQAVEAGGLMSYGADIPALSQISAKQVAKILRGTKPGDLPVEQPTKFELVLNRTTAKSLGLDLPATLLAAADDVID